jgi:translation initiation factor RLI1
VIWINPEYRILEEEAQILSRGNQGRKCMPKKMALVDYKKCHPEKQHSGFYAAALACSHGLLRQEAPFEIPMTDPFLCQGYGDCVRACPFKAISIVRM